MDTKSIIFQCPEDLKIKASNKLADCGISMSEFLRTCLEHFVSRDAGKTIQLEVKQVAEAATSSLV